MCGGNEYNPSRIWFLLMLSIWNVLRVYLLLQIIYAYELKPLNFGVNNTPIGFCLFFCCFSISLVSSFIIRIQFSIERVLSCNESKISSIVLNRHNFPSGRNEFTTISFSLFLLLHYVCLFKCGWFCVLQCLSPVSKQNNKLKNQFEEGCCCYCNKPCRRYIHTQVQWWMTSSLLEVEKRRGKKREQKDTIGLSQLIDVLHFRSCNNHFDFLQETNIFICVCVVHIHVVLCSLWVNTGCWIWSKGVESRKCVWAHCVRAPKTSK